MNIPKIPTKLIVALVLIAIGVIVYSRAEKLTIVKNGVTHPNEGGYIRSKIIGSLLVIIGIVMALQPRVPATEEILEGRK